MDFILNTIVSGFMWDILKDASKLAMAKLNEYLSCTTEYETRKVIAEKITQLVEKHSNSFDSYNIAIQSDENFIDYISSNVQYKTNFAKRMDYFISITNVYSYDKINLEIIAEYLGFSSVNDLNKYYLTSEEPSFQFLAEVASKLGINETWLKNGTGLTFAPTFKSDFAMDCYETVIDYNPAQIIFCLSQESHMGIILKQDQYKYVYCSKTWHFNDNVGGGGMMHIFSIYNLIKQLNQRNRLSNCLVKYFENENFDKLFFGKIPTSAVNYLDIRGRNTIYWLEDFISLESSNAYDDSFKYCQNVVKHYLNK